ncbi:probable plastid-lipid-associated protein 7, chloroplastic [Durio zibethinus]|uniref:Probable plastid-lipid-associated protein 7, chloroplastic n=1 Tax=Durio zibethinus TaxID=66656 RepID=A0A6P5YM74_DURZI|nr:probable plastid-lipid-associated protein 7, chloroplastic [Durio zibethinus]
MDAEEKENEPSEYRTVDLIKSDFYQAIKGINRGIFGVQSARKSEIEELVELLKSQNPTPDAALHLEKVGGCWKLVYSTITILGAKRTKLGLRHFLTLRDIYQSIDVTQAKAINVVEFDVRGLSLLNGQLTIEATFKIASKSRVDICYEKSTITPDQLRNVLWRKHDLLLSIFNPEGWLDVSYVDDTMMIGRDDKGNTFVLERSE